MSEVKKYISVLILLFLTYTVSSQYSMLDLTQPEQQKDFLQYLRRTVSLLEDKSVKEISKGVQLKNISDRAQEQMAKGMMKDTVYFKKVID